MDETIDQQTAGPINQAKRTGWFANVAKNPFIFGVALVSIFPYVSVLYHIYICFLTQ